MVYGLRPFGRSLRSLWYGLRPFVRSPLGRGRLLRSLLCEETEASTLPKRAAGERAKGRRPYKSERSERAAGTRSVPLCRARAARRNRIGLTRSLRRGGCRRRCGRCGCRRPRGRRVRRRGRGGGGGVRGG